MPPADEIEAADVVSHFPFVMTLCAMLLRGLLFTLLNGPAAVLVAEQQHFSSFGDFVGRGMLVQYGALAKSGSGIFSATVLLAVCACIGLLVTPLDRLLTIAIPWLLKRCAATLAPRRSIAQYFSPADFIGDRQLTLTRWLISHHAEKQHWEWVLFQYNIAWAAVTSVFVWVVLTWRTFETSIVVRSGVVAILITFIVAAMNWSRFMADVQGLYRTASEKGGSG